MFINLQWEMLISPSISVSYTPGVLTAAIALFTELNILLNLVSIGTLFVFYVVANAVIYRRYGSVGSMVKLPTVAFLVSFTLVSTLFTLLWHFMPAGMAKASLLGGCTLAAASMLYAFQCLVPQARKPEFWGVPLMPWIPSVSIFMNVFLLGSMDGGSYVRFASFTVLAVLVYVLYSVHASFDAEESTGVLVKGRVQDLEAEGGGSIRVQRD